ncbi:hypothetical protein [Roseateles sp. P5_E4]
MQRSFEPSQVAFCAAGTNVEFSGSEAGGFVVAIHGVVGLARTKVRLKVEFAGVAGIRVDDPSDRLASPENPIRTVEQSPWREQSLAEYVQRFGTKLLPVASPIQHYVVQGQEMTVAVLARTISITEAQ